jgi:hypothetical protein
MAIDAFAGLAVLSVCAGVLASQHGNGINLLVAWFVIVDKEARIPLGAGPTEKVIVAKLVRFLALLDAFHGANTNGNRLVEPSRAGVPIGLLRMGSVICGGGGLLLAALAYDNDERPGVLADPILVAGLAVRGPATQAPRGQADVFLSGCLSLRKRSFPSWRLGRPVATSSGTVGMPSIIVMR